MINCPFRTKVLLKHTVITNIINVYVYSVKKSNIIYNNIGSRATKNYKIRKNKLNLLYDGLILLKPIVHCEENPSKNHCSKQN